MGILHTPNAMASTAFLRRGLICARNIFDGEHTEQVSFSIFDLSFSFYMAAVRS